MSIRAGGQALADGVLMRTERAWAIARHDGTIETGPVPVNRFGTVPVLRVVWGLGGALKLGVVKGMLRKGSGDGARVRGSRRANRRFLAALVIAEALVFVLGIALHRVDAPGWIDPIMTVLPFAVVLAVLRLTTTPSMWRYHGAEHKAVSAHETGVDLDDTAAVLACPRVHNRCGTNLVFLLAVASFALAAVPAMLQLPVFLASLGLAVETMSLAARRPRFIGSRALLVGGRALQRYVTTAEPTPAEQAVACRALSAALAEHFRLEDGEAAPELAAA